MDGRYSTLSVENGKFCLLITRGTEWAEAIEAIKSKEYLLIENKLADGRVSKTLLFPEQLAYIKAVF